MVTSLLIATSMVPTAPIDSPLAALDSVYVVSTPSGAQGAAFLVTDRFLVTAAHVVDRDTVVDLEGTQDPPVRLNARVGYVDPVEDVAVLVLAAPAEQTPLQWSSQSVSVGEEVFAAGSPIDGVVLSRGRVSSTDTAQGIVSSTPVDPGNSGGPLLDAAGAVVGMVYAQSAFAGDAYSVPAAILQKAVANVTDSPADEIDDGVQPSIQVRDVGIVVALVLGGIALITSLLALVVAIGSRRRSKSTAPPITITLDEE